MARHTIGIKIGAGSSVYGGRAADVLNASTIATDASTAVADATTVGTDVTTVAANVATLVADGATPTQAHVTTLNTNWGTLSTDWTALNTAIGALNTSVAKTYPANADVVVSFDAATVVSIAALRQALDQVVLIAQGGGELTK